MVAKVCTLKKKWSQKLCGSALATPPKRKKPNPKSALMPRKTAVTRPMTTRQEVESSV